MTRRNEEREANQRVPTARSTILGNKRKITGVEEGLSPSEMDKSNITDRPEGNMGEKPMLETIPDYKDNFIKVRATLKPIQG